MRSDSVRIRVQGRKHYVCRTDIPKLKSRAHLARTPAVWWTMPRSRFSITATHDGKLVGFFKWHPYSRQSIVAGGTWVHPDWRGRGVARRMWEAALRHKKVRTVRVSVVSKGGRNLVRSLVKRKPNVKFLVIDYTS